jgi:hypothetical protein
MEMACVGAIRCHFGSVVAMKKGGKKYIIYILSNFYGIWNFYLEGVCKHKSLLCPDKNAIV